MAVQQGVCVYLWRVMYDLGQVLCMIQKRMSKDYFSRIGDEIGMLIWIRKWKEYDKELNVEYYR